jgi:hypothetical protein
MKSGIARDRLRAFPLQLTGENDTDSYRQTVGAWKVLVGMVGDKGGVLHFAARAEARCNPLDPGVAIRPAPSARLWADHPAAWWNESEPALIQKLGKTNSLLETVDVPTLLQIPAVHTCRIPLFSLHYEKLGFITRYRRTRCAYDEPERAVSDDFRRVRVGFKQPHGSLPNRSGDEVVPPQLPSRRMFMFRSCRLAATGIIYARTTYSPYRSRASFGRKHQGSLCHLFQLRSNTFFLSLIPSDASSRFFETW